MSAEAVSIDVAGPYYEDLHVGDRFDDAPALTLTDGHAAVHQAVLGDRLRLPLDVELSRRVLGPGGALAHPGLVCDIAIGQSTQATHRVVANLFYRGLVFHGAPRIGDTLRTTTEVVALRDNTPRAGRAPTGMAVLRVRTVDQRDDLILDFHRCAMLPMRSEQARPGNDDDLNKISPEAETTGPLSFIGRFDLRQYLELVPGRHAGGMAAGTRYVIETGDTVTAAPELVRLSLNLAAAHSDPTVSGRGQRLVYGGHTIGLALSHLTRALPNLVTIAGWRSCDHISPVYENDVLHSTVTVESIDCESAEGAALLDLSVETTATRADGTTREPVLDWKLIAVMAA
jgi:acyl dehydratase